VRDVMHLEGHSDEHIDSRMETLIETYLEGLREGAKSGKFNVRPHQGVLELLDALEPREDVVLGLLTGNVEAGARTKLTAAGIDPDRFRVNAFGSDHELRPQLPAIAQRRAKEKLGLDIAGERVVVIGDTPADIECGRSLGVKAIGVASGHYTVEQLQAYDPYAVFPSLRDTQSVVETIINA
jgi:phosphoglycolate phosphatase